MALGLLFIFGLLIQNRDENCRLAGWRPPSGEHSLWVVLILLASVPWVYGDIARYTGTLALARAKSKSTRVLASVALQVSGAPWR